MAKDEVGGGIVKLQLDGKDYELVPTLDACIEISKVSGGLNGAVQRLQQLDFETMCMVIGSGLRVDGKKLNARQRDDLVPEAVFRTGLAPVAADCINFCRLIANGGRALEDSGDDEDEGEGDTAPLESAT